METATAPIRNVAKYQMTKHGVLGSKIPTRSVLVFRADYGRFELQPVFENLCPTDAKVQLYKVVPAAEPDLERTSSRDITEDLSLETKRLPDQVGGRPDFCDILS